jgi:WD40 repeat protein
MPRRILLSSYFGLILLLPFMTGHAQTLSNCRPTPPMPPNVKPGIGGFSLSRYGKTLVVAAGDGKIRLINVNTGEVQRTLTGHTNMVYTAKFSPDEKLIASSSRDRTARIWDAKTGRELQKLNGFRCSVKAVAFSPDSRILGASGNDGMLKLWDVKTGKELKSLVHLNSADIDMATYSFVFNRDGKKIYAGNGDGTISEWDVALGKEMRAWKAHDQTSFRLLFSPDYRLLASFGDSVVKLWDTSTWREVRSMSMIRGPGTVDISSALAFSHGGTRIAASNAALDQKQTSYVYVQALVWNVRTGEKLFTLEGHKFDINGLIFTKDDRLLLTGGVDTMIKFWDMKTGSEVRTLTLTKQLSGTDFSL